MRFSDRDNILNLKSIEDERYRTIDLDHLVMYAIGQLEKLDAD